MLFSLIVLVCLIDVVGWEAVALVVGRFLVVFVLKSWTFLLSTRQVLFLVRGFVQFGLSCFLEIKPGSVAG